MKTEFNIEEFLSLDGYANMQETIDKLSPVEEVAEEVAEETGQETEELSDEEVSEIDKLLQES